MVAAGSISANEQRTAEPNRESLLLSCGICVAIAGPSSFSLHSVYDHQVLLKYVKLLSTSNYNRNLWPKINSTNDLFICCVLSYGMCVCV